MPGITEELIRKKAEHNEGEIFSLEELSLHQTEIEKIEHIDNWCRQLKILYLQSNLISKIENVGRLKKLEYLNLALNNVEKIENLQGCESLKKLDLTINFVSEITSVETLRSNSFLEELYLTGNPCVNFEGYREYVIAALPQLKRLDGKEIEKSARIQATQIFEKIRPKMIQQQEDYEAKRIEEKKSAKKEKERENTEEGGDKKSDDDFWNTKCDYTPESRKEMHQKMRENREKKTEPKFKKTEITRQRRFFNDKGDPMNMNEGKVDFTLTETEDDSAFILDVACYKHLDTSLIDADIQPKYVRVELKGDILQLVLLEEVSTDKSKAQRSQTTGHLVITMPKLNPPPKPVSMIKEELKAEGEESKNGSKKLTENRRETLEFDSSKSLRNTLANISKESTKTPKAALSLGRKKLKKEIVENPDFVDDPDVPPLF